MYFPFCLDYDRNFLRLFTKSLLGADFRKKNAMNTLNKIEEQQYRRFGPILLHVTLYRFEKKNAFKLIAIN